MKLCPKCGQVNDLGWRFCSRCGSPLPEAPPAQAPAPAAPERAAAPPTPSPIVSSSPPAPAPPPRFPPPPAVSAVPPYYPFDHLGRKEVDRTKTGILLLLVGALLGWIPFIGLIGLVLTLVGAILVILGRRVFGRAQARNVILSLVLFVGGIVAVVVLAVVFAFTLASSLMGGTPDIAGFRSAFTTYFYGTAIVTVVSGFASVLFTYALQKPVGKVLLWAAYVASSALSVGILLVLGPAIGDALAAALQSGTVDPAALDAVLASADQWSFLDIVPSLLFAAANYLAWDRIRRGEIPERPHLPSMPGAPQA